MRLYPFREILLAQYVFETHKHVVEDRFGKWISGLTARCGTVAAWLRRGYGVTTNCSL